MREGVNGKKGEGRGRGGEGTNLVPASESSTDSRSGDAVHRVELLTSRDTLRVTNSLLDEAGETHTTRRGRESAKLRGGGKGEETYRDPQLVICLIATALTPLLIPRIPSLRHMSPKSFHLLEKRGKRRRVSCCSRGNWDKGDARRGRDLTVDGELAAGNFGGLHAGAETCFWSRKGKGRQRISSPSIYAASSTSK